MARHKLTSINRKSTAGALLVALIGCSMALAQGTALFQGKIVTVIIGFAAGGGTDTFGRMAANFFAQYLPGSPTVIVRNVPGADGITAMNYFVEQAAPDRYSITVAASATADPLHSRAPHVRYNPTKFEGNP